MKSSMRRMLWILAIVYVVGSLDVLAAVEVLKVNGKVEVSVDGGKRWKKVRKGSLKKIPAQVRTAESAFADLRFLDGSLVRVTAKSLVEIEKAAKEGEGTVVQLDVEKGRMVAVTSDVRIDSKFEVKTPYGVCGARDESWCEVVDSGVFRCVRGSIVTVYVGFCLTPPINLSAGQELRPPKTSVDSARVELIETNDRRRLEHELEDLKRSGAKRQARKVGL